MIAITDFRKGLEFYSDGKIKSEMAYKNHKLHGIKTDYVYSQRGQEVSETEYVDGQAKPNSKSLPVTSAKNNTQSKDISDDGVSEAAQDIFGTMLKSVLVGRDNKSSSSSPNQPFSNSSGALYGCKVRCDGQFGRKEAEITINTPYSDYSSASSYAIDVAKKQKICDNYYFYGNSNPGGGKSLLNEHAECETWFYQR